MQLLDFSEIPSGNSGRIYAGPLSKKSLGLSKSYDQLARGLQIPFGNMPEGIEYILDALPSSDTCRMVVLILHFKLVTIS